MDVKPGLMHYAYGITEVFTCQLWEMQSHQVMWTHGPVISAHIS